MTPQSQFNEQLQINIGILGVTSTPVGELNRLGPSAAVVAATSDAFHMSIMIVRGLGRAHRRRRHGREGLRPRGGKAGLVLVDRCLQVRPSS